MVTLPSMKVRKNQNLSLSEYLDEVYINLVDFINKVKETSIIRKIWLTLKLMLKLSKSPDDERELLRSEQIIVTVGRTTKGSVEFFH